MTAGGETPDERIGYGFRLVLTRAPERDEERVLRGVYEKFLGKYSADSEAAEELLAQGESPLNELLDRAELASYAGVASLILNLDEAITKE